MKTNEIWLVMPVKQDAHRSYVKGCLVIKKDDCGGCVILTSIPKEKDRYLPGFEPMQERIFLTESFIRRVQ
jgi:hypothetical protein